MNIIVCVKCVLPRSQKEIAAGMIERENTLQIINPYDLYAIEAALNIRDRLKEPVHITVLSMGPATVGELLRQTFYLGADRVILLSDRSFAGADTLATSYTLQKAIEQIGAFDLIICGQQSTDGDTGQVGAILACNLGLPFLTQVQHIYDINFPVMICKRIADYETQIIQIPMPALICIKASANNPRSANLRDYFKRGGCSVEQWGRTAIHAEEKKCGKAGSATQVVELFKPALNTKCEFMKGTTGNMVNELYHIIMEKGFLQNL